MIDIEVTNDYNSNLSYDRKSIKYLFEQVFNKENIHSAKLSLILSDRKYLNELKKEYFGLDYFTDVIAFNLNEKNENINGEIYVSIDDVILNSKQFNQSINQEFKRIIIHGLLHVIGYNDDTDKNKNNMTKLENKYMSFISKTLLKIKC